MAQETKKELNYRRGAMKAWRTKRRLRAERFRDYQRRAHKAWRTKGATLGIGPYA